MVTTFKFPATMFKFQFGLIVDRTATGSLRMRFDKEALEEVWTSEHVSDEAISMGCREHLFGLVYVRDETPLLLAVLRHGAAAVGTNLAAEPIPGLLEAAIVEVGNSVLQFDALGVIRPLQTQPLVLEGPMKTRRVPNFSSMN